MSPFLVSFRALVEGATRGGARSGPGRIRSPSRAQPGESRPPVGHGQVSPKGEPGARAPSQQRRLPERACLRKGCLETFGPRRWDQRYCGGKPCRRELRRWHRLKQRATPKGRERHREQERRRRARRPPRRGPRRCARPAGGGQGHDGARGETLPRRPRGPVCDRPGCFDPPRETTGAPACYCGDECRRDLGRVRDRERKYVRRRTPAGRFKRGLEYARRRKLRDEGDAADPRGHRRRPPPRAPP